MSKSITTLCVAGMLVTGGLYLAQAQTPKPAADPRLDKIIQQNELLLKNQEEFKQQLKKFGEDLLQLRRRTS